MKVILMEKYFSKFEKLRNIFYQYQYKQNSLLSFLLVFILFACQPSYKQTEMINDKGQKVLQEWYAEGILKSIRLYLNEEKNDYVFVSWYEEGDMKDSARYINDVVTGLRKHFDAALGLMHFENYENGILNGIHKAVYKNGVTSYEGNRRNGLQTGEWKFHYPDGRPITYEYYDWEGSLLYFRKYDEDGIAIKSTGNPIIEISQQSIPIKAGDTINGIIDIAVPLNCIISLSILDSLAKPDKPLVIENIQSVSNDWYWSFSKRGKHKLWFVVNIRDKKSNESKESKVSRDFSVGL